MFKSFSLKAKLISLCTVLAMFAVFMGIASYFISQDVVHKYEYVANVILPKGQLVASKRGTIKDIRGAIRGVALTGASETMIDKQLENIAKAKVNLQDLEKKYSEMLKGPGEEDFAKAITDSIQAYVSLIDEMIAMHKNKTPASQAQFIETLLGKERENYDKVMEDFQKMIVYQEERVKFRTSDASGQADFGNILSASLAISAFVLALLIGSLFSSSLVKQLRSIAGRIETGSSQVANASFEISEAGTELSASATEQAAAMQETVASIDEVSAMVNKNSENARHSQKSAETSTTAVHRGKQVIGDMLQAMNEINSSNDDISKQTEQSNQEISGIVKVISEIGSKTKVINDIVFQTKLLSFNASVEAARAGEHGKGFAVVAEEVGNLAQMSGNAAKDISQLLEESIRKVESTVQATRAKVEGLVNRGKEKIENGMTTAKRCGEVFDEIERSVSEVSGMVAEIAHASQEQAQGVQEITKAMGQMDQGTQQNATAAQQVASTSEQLTNQANILKSTVTALLEAVEGQKNPGGNSGGATGSASSMSSIAHSNRSASLASVPAIHRTSSQPADDGISRVA